jgi:hypothetical protein
MRLRVGIVERLRDYPARDGIVSLFLHPDEIVLEALDFVVFLDVVLGELLALLVFLGAFVLELLDLPGHLPNHGLGVGVCLFGLLRPQDYVVAPKGDAAVARVVEIDRVALGIIGGHDVATRWRSRLD